MRQKWKAAILLLTVISLLGGCFAEKPVLEELDPEGKVKIKVMYHNEESFYRDYGNGFDANFNEKYPNIEFEVISLIKMYRDIEKNGTSYEEEYLKLIENNKPDVLFTEKTDLFEKLAQEGKLYNLDPIIAQEKLDVDGYMPGLIDMLRGYGEGSLYGLAPSFYTQNLYYNADLFREYHIDPPRNQMSWKEVLELSKRFAGLGSEDKPIYGLTEEFGRADDLLFGMAATSSLRALDAKGEKLAFNTEGWKEAMELVADAVRSKAVFTHPLGEEGVSYYLQSEPFFGGEVAMVLGSSMFLNQILQGTRQENVKEIEWNMVTVPVDPASPNESPFVDLNGIYAIAADSANKRAAWEFMKFVNSPEMAKAVSRSPHAGLQTRSGFTKEVAGKSTESFYMLRPKAGGGSIWGGSNVNRPDEFTFGFPSLVRKQLYEMVENGKSAEVAAAAIEGEGNALLKQARAAQKAKGNAAKK
ncbi:extracellular solute-binding protein [Paenibacillus profundus]|uniref:Extracellular solute-binding protein n=1 Tax=Paenibacillus profundus TaxID=1173085 RepID=A0ABS8YK45_9BACL|nr:extracellular solute-binding protein [Paenibacillus profundus]MCE5171319.1 extracellular solute-binding protein [Paenibacillus profundus]